MLEHWQVSYPLQHALMHILREMLVKTLGLDSTKELKRFNDCIRMHLHPSHLRNLIDAHRRNEEEGITDPEREESGETR